LDEEIGQALRGWKVNRLSKVDLAILRLAAFEILTVSDMPIKVSINEAVELAKKYSMDAAPAFINGILGSLATKGVEDDGAK
jgi:N utilization substance protein B